MSAQLLPRSKRRHRCGEDLRYSHQLEDSGCWKWPHCALPRGWVECRAHRVLDLGSHHPISWIHLLREDEPLPPTGERHNNQSGQHFLLLVWRMQRPGSDSFSPFFSSINSNVDRQLCKYWNKLCLQSGSTKLQRQNSWPPCRPMGRLLRPRP